jgi:hypothetical protein
MAITKLFLKNHLKIYLIAVLTLLNLTSSYALASDLDKTFTLATELSKCAGYYKFASDFNEKQGNKATAKDRHHMANGAKASAAYLMSLQYGADNPNKPPINLEVYFPFVDGISDAIYAQITAYYEANQEEPVRQLYQRCTELIPVQSETLDKIRKSVYLPNSN